MFRQINEYMDKFLSRQECGFRKGYSTQQCLLTVLEKWRSAVDNKTESKELKSAYICWEEILFGVTRGSILGPLLFNIFLSDLFYMMSHTDFASYADDNTSYVSSDTINEVIKRLETASFKLFKWFADN